MIESVEDKYRKEILAAFGKHLSSLRELPITSKKRGIIRNIITETLEAFPEKIKLPPIRAMASALGVTVVSVQKAISGLAAEGLLITKKRSSVISGIKPKEDLANLNEPSAFCPFEMKFKFRTDSGDDYQRKMWLEIRDCFNSEHPTVDVEIDFASYRKRTCESDDAMECAGYGWQAQAGNINPMSIRRFMPTGKNISQQADTYGDMHIPLYYRTHYLFYNPRLLKTHNIPLPEYSDFNGQLDYMINSGRKCKKVNLEDKPFAITHPVTLLGNLLPAFLDYAKNNSFEPEKKKNLLEGFEKILIYLSLCKFDYNETHLGTDYEFNDFFTERCPFFIGTSSSYWDFKNRSIAPGWEVYPLFAVDDKFVKWPVVGMISANTKAPIESVKFISFLLREDIQSKFIAPTGMIPANLNIKEAEFLFDKNIAAKFNADFKTSTPLFLKEEKDYYLVNSILNSEFWTAHLNKNISGGKLLEQATFLVKAINENYNV